MSSEMYDRHPIGEKYTKNFRVYIKRRDKFISAFHDIDLFVDRENFIVNVVNEIPRFETGKFEIRTGEPMTPIKQDIKNGRVRYYPNIFPCHGSMWNYGALPQTWEDPKNPDRITGLNGDDDPLDIIEIGNIKKEIGEVYSAKLLGAIGLIDDGETDWKIIAIDRRDPLFNQLNSIADVERLMPDLISRSVDFFKTYKIPAGKKANRIFESEGKIVYENVKEIVEEAHRAWENMEKKNGSCSLKDFKAEEHGGDETVELNEDEMKYEFITQ